MTSLLLITHGHVGEVMLAMVIETLGKQVMPAVCLSVASDDDPAELLSRARQIITDLGGDDVIVVTDLFGSTPSNIAARLVDEFDGLVMIAGLNIPMLIRLFSYAEQELGVLVAKALDGGRNGIFVYDPGYDG